MAGRYALLIGNSDFEDEALPGLAAPTNDVIALKDVLERKDIAGFETTLLVNAGMEQARRAIAALFRDKAADDLIVLYYTGHGLRDDRGELYLAMPGTTATDPTAISLEADYVRKQMDRTASQRQVLILDCCHSGAFRVSGAKDAKNQPKLFQTDFNPGGHGRFILAASSANESAFEFEGRSIFTRHLVDGLKSGEAAPDKSEITIHDLHAFVSRRVAAEKAPMQPRLWVDEQTEPVVIARNPNPRRPLPEEEVALLWDKDPYRALGGATRLIDILRGPDAQLASDAKRQLRERLAKPADLSVMVADAIRRALQAQPLQESEMERRLTELETRLVAQNAIPGKSAPPLNEEIADLKAQIAVVPDREPLTPLTVFRDIDAAWCPEMVVLPAGSFLMGSPEGEAGRYDREGPQRQVEVASFAIGRYPVTFAEYDHFCEATGRDKPDDEKWGRGRMPVINVSWLDAVAYSAWLSDETGEHYRLPSEAEWEYACRAEKTTAFWWGDEFDPKMANASESRLRKMSDVGSYASESRLRKMSEVGNYPANPWGLYDTLGNGWEWVEDHFHWTYGSAPSVGRAWIDAAAEENRPRVLRGGSWPLRRDLARCACRHGGDPDLRRGGIGFRVARSSQS